MFINKISMIDYKRFHNLTIDLGDNPKRIIALVGPNGCGKSSVFDAMLYVANTYFHIGQGNDRDYKYHSLKQDRTFNSNNVRLTINNKTYSEIYNIKRREGLENSIFCFRSCFRYNSELKIQQTIAINDMLRNNYGASNASDIDQRMEENYRRLLNKFNKYSRENDAKPSEAIAHILGEINNSLSNCLNLKICDMGSVEEDRGTLYFIKDDSNIQFEYNVLSAGEKEVVDILIDLYLRRDYFKDSIYIIDEPELHLNTSIQRKLLIEINKLIPVNSQIWIATHSIGFLRALQEELKDESSIIKFDINNKWASYEYVLRPTKLSRKEWQELFSTALDDLAFLVSPRTIVYCEGKDKPKKNGIEQGMDALVYNNIFNHAYPDVLFVSSGGNTELDQRSDIAILILSKVFKDISILVLKDMDMASGKEVNLEVRDNYLKNNPNNHRVLKRFEIENYLYDKEVLNNFCIDNNLVFNNEMYDNLINDIVLDNVKDKTGDIKKCCNYNKNIKKDDFKILLSGYIKPDMDVYKELENIIFK